MRLAWFAVAATFIGLAVAHYRTKPAVTVEHAHNPGECWQCYLDSGTTVTA